MQKIKKIFLLSLIVLFFIHSSPVLAVDDTAPTTAASLSGTFGSNGWYTTTVNVTLTATDPESGVASTEYWIDSGTHSIVNFLPGSPTTVQFSVSGSGTHTVSYFSTNRDGVAESTQSTASFKVDTLAPFNWRDFSAQQINDHTFVLSIEVDDDESGLDPASAYYNYSVDGINWGYYSDTTKCNSTFVPQDPNKNPNEVGSGWKAVASTTPSTPGALTMVLRTDNVDFCNSQWNLTEAVQFYIKDMAGNESYKLQLLFGPWLQTSGGDFHSQGAISFSSTGASKDVVSSKISPINNMTSDNNWYLTPYDMASVGVNYNSLYTKLSSPTTPLPGGKLPLLSGSYLVNGDFTIDNNTLPANLSTTQNFGAVVFINGRLTINLDYGLHNSSGIVFIVKNDLLLDRAVDNLAGFFIVDGNINISYNGNNSNQLNLNGSLVGNGTWRLGKNLGGTNNVANAAEKFNYQPSYLNNKDLINLLTVNPTYSWSEVAP